MGTGKATWGGTPSQNNTKKEKQTHQCQKNKLEQIASKWLDAFSEYTSKDQETHRRLAKNIKTIELKIINTELPKGEAKLAAKICNMYLVPAIYWASILTQMPLNDLNMLDSLLTKRAKQNMD